MQAAVHGSAAAVQPSSNQRPGWEGSVRRLVWVGRLGLAVWIQASVQYLTERLWKEEVALVRLQTSTCDWITLEDYEDGEESSEQAEVEEVTHAQLADAPSKSLLPADLGDAPALARATVHEPQALVPVQKGGESEGEVTRWLDGWRFLFSGYSSQANELSQALSPDEEFDLIAARNYVWNKAVKPMLLVGLSELVFLHCPRAVVAIQILFHPLRVISVRLVCPGWASDSIWRCFNFTLKRRGTTSAMAGLIPRLMCHILGEYYHRLRVEDKIRRFLRRHRISRQYQTMSENVERLCAGLVNTIISTTISYPFTVLERRMCAERVTPASMNNGVSFGRYLVSTVHREGIGSLFAGYIEAILIVIPKFCLRFTSKVNDQVMAHVLGARWFAVPVALSACSSARHSLRARMGLLPSLLIGLSDACAASYKVLAERGAIPGRQRTTRSSRSSTPSLPIVTFRSEESRTAWFRTAYGDTHAALGGAEAGTAGAAGGGPGEEAGRGEHGAAVAAGEDGAGGAGAGERRPMWAVLRGADFAFLQPISLTIDPNNMLSSTFSVLEGLPSHLLVNRPLFITFQGQQGADWGGLRRVWMARVAEELFDPRLGLVLPVFSTAGVPTGRVMINPAPEFSCSDQFPALHDGDMAERYYRFIGRMIGLSLISGDPLGVALTSAFYRTLLAKQPFKVMLMGPPCAGKTSESRLLARRCRLRHVTVEKLVRYHLHHNTSQGSKVRSFVQMLSPQLQGSSAEATSQALLSCLFPSEAWAHAAEDLLYDMLVQYLAQRRIAFRGWVLDGLPVSERFTLKLLGKGEPFRPDCALVLQLSDAELRRRFKRRAAKLAPPHDARLLASLQRSAAQYRANKEAVVQALRDMGVACCLVHADPRPRAPADPHRPRDADEAGSEPAGEGSARRGSLEDESGPQEPLEDAGKQLPEEHGGPHPQLAEAAQGGKGELQAESPAAEEGAKEGASGEVRESGGEVGSVHRELAMVVDRLRWQGGVAPDLGDLKETDPEEATKLERLRELPAEELDAWLDLGQLGFVTTSKEATVASLLGIPLNRVSRVETEPLGGHSKRDRVSRETVEEYVELVCHKKLVQDVADQMAHVKLSLEEMIPNKLLRDLVTPRQLEDRLAGEPDVDAADWRAHSVAKGFKEASPQIEWFWQHVGECGEAERLRLLNWTTGMVRTPVGGFSQMPHRFTIQCDPDEAHAEHLPVAHTCAFQLDLPLYQTKEVLVSKLRFAMEHAHDFQLV